MMPLHVLSSSAHLRRPTLRLAGALAACLACGGALADLYGYVDEKGVPHLSNVPLDSRYYLFKKEPPRPTMPVPVPMEPPAAGKTARIDPALRKQYSPLIANVAKRHQLDAALLHAVVAVESGYNPKAVSPRGAIGLMQLMPDTARRYAVRNMWDPRENLDAGARYLRDLMALFGNDLALALAAYNAGEEAVIQSGNRIPPFAETRSYVPRVLRHYRHYRRSPGT